MCHPDVVVPIPLFLYDFGRLNGAWEVYIEVPIDDVVVCADFWNTIEPNILREDEFKLHAQAYLIDTRGGRGGGGMYGLCHTKWLLKTICTISCDGSLTRSCQNRSRIDP